MNVIVVDGHTVVRTILCQLLANELDIETVTGADSGQAALQLLSNGLQANIIITGVNLPGMNGYDLTRKIVALKQGPKVIVLTSLPKRMSCEMALEAGAKECLSKDGNYAELLAAVRKVHDCQYDYVS
ncbi:response regulator [Mucilaginibacter antarcticus]|uniref:Response regulator transcription factor n=1 Tax=Mucilaginibacter antarcticus TaxID=1855725 RepID=A0ABW5XP15_9SPHI